MYFSEQIVARRTRWSEFGRPARLKGDMFNKMGSKKFAESLGIRAPKILETMNSIDKLKELESYPPRFVLKPFSGSNNRGVFVFENGVNLLDDTITTRDGVLAAVKGNDVVCNSPFLVEEMVENYDRRPGVPNDFKFYCFGGNIAFIHIVERNSGRQSRLNRHWFLREDFSPLGISIQKSQEHCNEPVQRPDCFGEMLRLSRAVASKLNMFVRVDLYASPDGPVFGELTPFPHGGKGYTKDGDIWLGAKWRGTEGASWMDWTLDVRRTLKMLMRIRRAE